MMSFNSSASLFSLYLDDLSGGSGVLKSITTILLGLICDLQWNWMYLSLVHIYLGL